MPSLDGHIRILPIHVANKIAAGEVIERPASVVKELVENSIDAGAKTIKISVSQGGRKSISIQDDGCGMTREDAIMCLERQATSKIRDVWDIEEIGTLGFRGEAIPSIASVSRFSLITRRHDADEGTRVDVDAGTLSGVHSAGAPPGTLVEVRDLFCNVPARRKFLRAVATEEGHIKNFFTSVALSHSAISFSLSFDGRELYRLAAATSVRDRARELLGDEFMDTALEVNYEKDDIAVSGYIEKPNLSTPTRKDQFIFINARAATAAPVAYALRDAYPRRQGDARPAAILFISLPPKSIDVNVHPAKREVRFRNGSAVKLAIEEAITNALSPWHDRDASTSQAAIAIPGPIENTRPAPPAQTPPPLRDNRQATSQPTTTTLEPRTSKLETRNSNLEPRNSKLETQTSNLEPKTSTLDSRNSKLETRPVAASLPMAAASGEKAKPWAWYKFLAFTDSGFLLLETDSGIVTLNPRAARERISYERLLARDMPPASQMLLIPETVQLPPADFHRIESSLGAIRSMGFGIEPFGRDTFKIDSIPVILSGSSVRDALETIANDLASIGTGRTSRWREELIAKSIARSYAGTRIRLDENSASRLVEELVACRMPYVCPRGKTVMIFTSNRELERKFS